MTNDQNRRYWPVGMAGPADEHGAIAHIKTMITGQPKQVEKYDNTLTKRLIIAARRNALTWADRIAIGEAIAKITPSAEAQEPVYEGGRESVEDARAIVESFGPGVEGLNDTFARQVLLAGEVKRLRSLYESAVACRHVLRDAERYRQLRAGNDYKTDGPMVVLYESGIDRGDRPYWSLEGEALDANVDAASAARGNHVPEDDEEGTDA